MDYVRREVEERQRVYEAIDPDGIEGFGHVEENCAIEPLYDEIPGYSFNEAGKLQERPMSRFEPKLLFSRHSAFAYYM